MVKKILLAVAVAFVSSLPLLHEGLLPTHDGEYHVIRFFEFNKTLLDGNLYPRWAPDLNNGFGIPLFNYVYPLPNYVASFFHLFGSSFIDSFKLNMLAAILFGSVFFYLWTRKFWGDWGALVSSVFYSFAPYHLLDVYIRGSVGEVWALAFLPAFLWSVTKFLRENKFLYAVLSSIFLSLIVFSHNILALMFILFCISYSLFVLIIQKSKRHYSKLLFVFVLAIGLSAVFWMPAIFEKQYVRGLEVYDYSSNFPEIYQLIIPSWGSGFSGALQNGLSFQIGLANLLAIFLSVLLLFKKNAGKYKKIIYFFLASFLIVLVLMLSISKPVWQMIPLMNYFQFPWRLLSLEIVICSFLAGGTIFMWKEKTLSIVLILIVVLLGLGYIKPAYYHLRDDNYYITKSNFIDGTNSPGNAFNTVWAGDLKKQKEKIVSSNGKISNVNIKSTKYTFNISSNERNEVFINTVYFPGWTVYVDGKAQEVQRGTEGNFYFTVPKGDHEVIVRFEDTLLRKISSIISLFSLLGALLILVRFVKIKR